MFDIKKAYGFDKKKANQGVKFVFGVNPDEDWINLCRIPNDNYNEAIEKAHRDNHKRLAALKTQDPKLAAKENVKIMNKVLAETIVTNWGAGLGIDGKVFPHSVDNCVALFDAYPDFKQACIDFATEPSNYPLDEDIEEVKK